MKPLDGRTANQNASPEPAGEEDNEGTGLPLLHTWGRVYAVVLGCFVVWVALLFALSVVFR
jgi:hypothetical protein